MKYAWAALGVAGMLALLFGGGIMGVFIYNFTEDDPVSKVVLMIGDGMGENHLKCAAEDYDISLNMNLLAFSGKVETASLSETEGLAHATDSAAAAIAMAYGKSVYNGKLVAKDESGNKLKSITQLAKENDLGVGIVTSDYLCGATVAAFSATEEDRYNYENIRIDQYASGIDLFLGADFDDGAGQNYYAQEKENIITGGYEFVDDYSQLKVGDNKIFGAFASVAAKQEEGVDENKNPLLSQLATFAIDYMEENFPNGYLLIIEGDGMDKNAHSWDSKTDTAAGIEALAEFDKSVGLVKGKLEKAEGDCALIVTSDHETGALAFDEEEGKYCYNSHQHTNRNVPYYIYAQSCSLNQTIKNTEIFTYMKTCLSV